MIFTSRNPMVSLKSDSNNEQLSNLGVNLDSKSFSPIVSFYHNNNNNNQGPGKNPQEPGKKTR